MLSWLNKSANCLVNVLVSVFKTYRSGPIIIKVHWRKHKRRFFVWSKTNKFIFDRSAQMHSTLEVIFWHSVRIRVRIGPHHPLPVVRGDWIGRSFGWDRKNRGPVSQQVWHDKDPSLLKGPEHKPKFCSPSPVMVTSPYKWNILERDIKH
jgi:hypothetical protein